MSLWVVGTEGGGGSVTYLLDGTDNTGRAIGCITTTGLNPSFALRRIIKPYLEEWPILETIEINLNSISLIH